MKCDGLLTCELRCGTAQLSSALRARFLCGDFVRSGEGKIEVIKRRKNFVSFLFSFAGPTCGLKVVYRGAQGRGGVSRGGGDE